MKSEQSNQAVIDTERAVYSVGLIGLGRIASTYGSADNPCSYCHAAGLWQSDRVRLSGVVDIAEPQRAAFRERWGSVLNDCPGYDSLDDLCAAGVPDIIAVCVRGPEHFAILKQVIDAGPKHIILEKPPTCSLAEADEIIALARAAGIGITVSYSRHFAPVNLHMQKRVQEGLVGEVHTVICYADNPFLSAGSHGVDAICQFAGYEAESIAATGWPTEATRDGYEPEPNLKTAVIRFRNGITGILLAKPGEHGVFYVDVLGSKGHARSGMYTAPVATVEGKTLTGDDLGVPAETSVFTQLYGKVAAYLDGGPAPHCHDADWHAVNEICFAGVESVADNGTPCAIPTARRDRLVFANG